MKNQRLLAGAIVMVAGSIIASQNTFPQGALKLTGPVLFIYGLCLHASGFFEFKKFED